MLLDAPPRPRPQVKVISRAEDDARGHVAGLVAARGRASALDVAASLKVPAALALEHLLDAEDFGSVCRDKGPAGLTFFPNEFCRRPGVLAS